MRKIIDLTGKKFNRLTVIEPVLKDGKKRVYWKCKCDCGREKLVRPEHLKSGAIKSCGCLSDEKRRIGYKKHGLSGSRIYFVLSNIKQRCYNKKDKEYKNYGGRGIKICDEWLNKKNGLLNFYKWAKSNGYDEKAKKGICTIDRIDVNGDYCPQNCRWVSMNKQNRNKRNNFIIEFNKEKMCLCEWAKKTGISRAVIGSRLKSGWDIKDALTKPIYKQFSHKRRRLGGTT